MFNKILNNVLLVSTCALGGGVINYIHNVVFRNKYEKYYSNDYNTLMYNNGFFVGGVIGIAISYLKCPYALNKTLKLEN
jgi:hypothetical protein